jgi:hypothetical protein
VNASRRQPAIYFPLESGRYEVKPGLFPFGTDFGNAEADRKVFQIDGRFVEYRAAKLSARAERLSKYYCLHNYTQLIAHRVARFITERLVDEYPQHFALEQLSHGHAALHCMLTDDTLIFDAEMRLVDVRTPTHPSPPYASTLDALACQVQEDLAVVALTTAGDWLSALHLCCPNHWAAEDKIGKDFASIHNPVPGITKINAKARALTEAMIYRGPYVRFVWGLSTDTRLNHHPQPPRCSLRKWRGRAFTKQDPKLWLRVERQVLWGFADVRAALFAIHTYFTDCLDIKREPAQLEKLVSAIESMQPATLAYKGLAEFRDDAVAWLTETITSPVTKT